MPIYTNTEPAAGSVLATSQGLLLGNTQYVKQSVGTDHNFSSNTSNATDGYHKDIHLIPQSPTPSPIALIGQLFSQTNGGVTNLCYLSDTNVFTQLTGSGASAGTNGYTTLAGGIILQWGVVSGLSTHWPTSDQTLNFSAPNITFPNNIFIVLTNFTGTSSSSGDIGINSISLGNFHWQFGGSSSSSYTGFYWIAIGN